MTEKPAADRGYWTQNFILLLSSSLAGCTKHVFEYCLRVLFWLLVPSVVEWSNWEHSINLWVLLTDPTYWTAVVTVVTAERRFCSTKISWIFPKQCVCRRYSLSCPDLLANKTHIECICSNFTVTYLFYVPDCIEVLTTIKGKTLLLKNGY